MDKRFSLGIRQRLMIVFVFMIVLLCVNAFIGISINRSAKNINRKISEVYKPLMENIVNMDDIQKASIRYTQVWIESRKLEDKQMLKNLVQIEYPQSRLQLGRFLPELKKEEIRKKINQLIGKIDQVVVYEKELMDILTSQADFENIERLLYCRNLLEKNIVPFSIQNAELLNAIKIQVKSQIQELEKTVNQKAFAFNFLTYVITGILVVIIIFLIVALPLNMTKRIKNSVSQLIEINKGIIPEKIEKKTRDELGSLEIEINDLVDRLDGIKSFAAEMGKGNLHAKVKSIENWGTIGSSLDGMRKSLEEIAEIQEKRRHEEELNSWISTGIAHFNEILRVKNSTIEELSYEIVKELVRYINAVIGGVYIVKTNEEGKEILEITGLFAYDRKRYVEIQVEPGEGMVGTVYIERHKIYMREVPENYLKISSGLGEAEPNEILIVPLMHNERIHGVIELATLDTFEDFKIEFVEKIAEGLASTISSVLVNSETARLLAESNEKAEKLHSQEEELRQNMEELQAAQEEKERQSKHVKSTQKNLEEIIHNIPLPVFVKDENGKYLLVNKEQEKLMGKRSEEIIGLTDADFVKDDQELLEIRNTDEQVIKKSKRVELPEQRITFENNKSRYIKTIKLPILNNESCQINVLGLSHFINK